MAKPRERIATGLSIKDIMGLSMVTFNKYTPKQQREITSRLASAANKRYKKLVMSDIQNPSRLRFEMSGGKVSVKGKSGSELKEEFFRAKQFLNQRNSTIKGWKQTQKKLKEELESEELEGEYAGLAYSYYDLLQEINPEIMDKVTKYSLVEHITEELKNGTSHDDIIKQSLDFAEDLYKKEQERYNTSGTSFREKMKNDVYRKKKKRKNKRK